MSSEAVEQARERVREVFRAGGGYSNALSEFETAVREEAVRETAQRYESVLSEALYLLEEAFPDERHSAWSTIVSVRALLPDPSTEGK